MITLPTIHINGTGAKTLFDDYRAAMDAISDARQVLNKIEFHPRDYYVQGDNTFAKAQTERREMYAKLDDIWENLMAVALHVQEFVK